MTQRRSAETELLAQLGGWRGIFDSGFPVVVFVIANAMAGLSVGVWAAIGAGAVVFALRLVRRQSVQQAVSGFLGVAIAAFIASRLHRAEGFYLPGILLSAASLVVVAGSVLVRWPLVGVVWGYFEGTGTTWRQDRALRRTYTLATLPWVAMYAAKAIVQGLLYLDEKAGWLAVARIAMGYPLLALVVLATVWIVRRGTGAGGGRSRHSAHQGA